MMYTFLCHFSTQDRAHVQVQSDITFQVNWALRTNYRSIHRVRRLRVRSFSITPPCRQLHSVFGGHMNGSNDNEYSDAPRPGMSSKRRRADSCEACCQCALLNVQRSPLLFDFDWHGWIDWPCLCLFYLLNRLTWLLLQAFATTPLQAQLTDTDRS